MTEREAPHQREDERPATVPSLADLVDDVSGGTPLSEGMAKHERVFDVLMGKGATFQTITTTGATLYGLTASVVLMEAEVAEVEGFTAAPQAG